MAGKILPYVLVSFVQVAVALLVGILWFKVEIAGSLLLLLALSVVFLVGSLGIGLFVSTVSKTQSQAMQMAMVTVFPAFILSGFIFPREAMPTILYYLGYLVPPHLLSEDPARDLPEGYRARVPLVRGAAAGGLRAGGLHHERASGSRRSWGRAMMCSFIGDTPNPARRCALDPPLAVEADGLWKRFGEVEAVRGLDLRVQEGRDLRPGGTGRRRQDHDAADAVRRC